MENNSVSVGMVWMKAAVTGSLWASSEIILGSFLHNLRVPFSSILLTGIGIMVLVSMSMRWKEKGLIWRAGLICAVMKSVSPSAVIFGPMVAILLESLLLEIPVRISGRSFPGFIVGGMLAMSWNLVHKIINLLIYYGFNMIDLYTSMVLYAGNQLGLGKLDPWTPIMLLWSIYLVTGALAAVMGILIGKKPAGAILPVKSTGQGTMEPSTKPADAPAFRYSFLFLGLTVAGMVTVLFLLNSPWPVTGFIVGTFLLLVWLIRYRGAVNKLLKPKFWILFLVITMLSGFLVTKLNSGGLTWKDGFITGLEMNFRAAVMMIGFSALAKELSNPVIRRFFLQTWFRQLPLALEVAFATLPFALAGLPAWKEIRRNPLLSLRKFIDHADLWLAGYRKKNAGTKKVIIITGNPGSGKTTLALWLAGNLKSVGLRTGGILAPARFAGNASVLPGDFSDCSFENETTLHATPAVPGYGDGGKNTRPESSGKTGYDLLDIDGGTVMPLAQTEPDPEMEHTGRYYFNPAAIKKGKEILLPDKVKEYDVVFIDEIGPWEIAGHGWATSLRHLLEQTEVHLALCVRTGIVDRVITHWQIDETLVIGVNEFTRDEVLEKIRGFLNRQAKEAQ